MRVLVTAGNTQVPVDRVRCITNIFTGRTGTRIALHAWGRGHTVRLLTSHPEVVPELAAGAELSAERWDVRTYRTFDDLRQLMDEAIRPGLFDGVIHCAAVNDYLFAGVYAAAAGTRFEPESACWLAGGMPRLEDRAAGKVKSDEPELWVRLVRAPKLIDFLRGDWAFRGVLVKFKLEVGVAEEQLLAIAERSRVHSQADLMVANTLEGADAWAYLGPVGGRYEHLTRQEMPGRLLSEVERLHGEKSHG